MQSKVLAALKKADGKTPVDAIENLFANDLSGNFAKRMTKMFGEPIEDADDLILALEKSNNFKNFFEVVD